MHLRKSWSRSSTLMKIWHKMSQCPHSAYDLMPLQGAHLAFFQCCPNPRPGLWQHFSLAECPWTLASLPNELAKGLGASRQCSASLFSNCLLVNESQKRLSGFRGYIPITLACLDMVWRHPLFSNVKIVQQQPAKKLQKSRNIVASFWKLLEARQKQMKLVIFRGHCCTLALENNDPNQLNEIHHNIYHFIISFSGESTLWHNNTSYVRCGVTRWDHFSFSPLSHKSDLAKHSFESILCELNIHRATAEVQTG